MMHSLDMDFIYEDPRFKKAPFLNQEDVPALERIMLEKVQEKTLDEWMAILVGETGNVAAEPYLTSEQALEHPQIVHNGNVQGLEAPGAGKKRQLGPDGEHEGDPRHYQGVGASVGPAHRRGPRPA